MEVQRSESDGSSRLNTARFLNFIPPITNLDWFGSGSGRSTILVFLITNLFVLFPVVCMAENEIPTHFV
jgi:hypothetical protein